MRSLLTSILLAATAAFGADTATTIPAHQPMSPGDLLSIRALHVAEPGQLANEIEKLLNEFELSSRPVSEEAKRLADILPLAGESETFAMAEVMNGGIAQQMYLLPHDADKAVDFVLEPREILFIPASAAKRTSAKIAEAAIQMAVGAVIFRRSNQSWEA